MKRQHRGLVAALALVSLTLWGVEDARRRDWADAPPRTAGQRANAKTPLQSLIAAEKSFAALSASKGMRTAFLANLDEQSVVFRPVAVNGMAVWKERPESQARLLWEPSYAEVAGSGDFGITTGPWELHPAPGGDPTVSYGQFFSVWGRDARTPWKVLVDIGVTHDKPAHGGLGDVEVASGPDHPATSTVDTTGSLMLMTIDRSMGTMVGRVGRNALGTWISKDLLYLRDGLAPTRAQQAQESLGGTIKHTTWRPAGSRVARSGDLGCTYGVREDSTGVSFQDPDTTAYVHVWRRLDPASQWKLAAVVESPVKR